VIFDVLVIVPLFVNSIRVRNFFFFLTSLYFDISIFVFVDNIVFLSFFFFSVSLALNRRKLLAYKICFE
jgi:hypothetical protein